MLDDGVDLLARHAGKPFEKFLHCRAALDVLEQRAHRHASVLEEPGAADFSGDAFDGRARGGGSSTEASTGEEWPPGPMRRT